MVRNHNSDSRVHSARRIRDKAKYDVLCENRVRETRAHNRNTKNARGVRKVYAHGDDEKFRKRLRKKQGKALKKVRRDIDYQSDSSNEGLIPIGLATGKSKRRAIKNANKAVKKLRNVENHLNEHLVDTAQLERERGDHFEDQYFKAREGMQRNAVETLLRRQELNHEKDLRGVGRQISKLEEALNTRDTDHEKDIELKQLRVERSFYKAAARGDVDYYSVTAAGYGSDDGLGWRRNSSHRQLGTNRNHRYGRNSGRCPYDGDSVYNRANKLQSEIRQTRLELENANLKTRERLSCQYGQGYGGNVGGYNSYVGYDVNGVGYGCNTAIQYFRDEFGRTFYCAKNVYGIVTRWYV
jgi:hypothetical protein